MRLVLAAAATALVVAGGAGGAPSAHTFPKLLVQEHGRSTTIEIVAAPSAPVVESQLCENGAVVSVPRSEPRT